MCGRFDWRWLPAGGAVVTAAAAASAAAAAAVLVQLLVLARRRRTLEERRTGPQREDLYLEVGVCKYVSKQHGLTFVTRSCVEFEWHFCTPVCISCCFFRLNCKFNFSLSHVHCAVLVLNDTIWSRCRCRCGDWPIRDIMTTMHGLSTTIRQTIYEFSLLKYRTASTHTFYVNFIAHPSTHSINRYIRVVETRDRRRTDAGGKKTQPYVLGSRVMLPRLLRMSH